MKASCSTTREFLIRVFDGPDQMNSAQSLAFEAALKEFRWFQDYYKKGITVKIETLSNSKVRNECKHIFSLSQIIDWLVEDSENAHVDAYFLLCHLHQGFKHWNCSMLALQEDYKRLAIHGNGLPRGEQIFCPAFTQDKFDYLKLIPEYVNPTLKIDVRHRQDYLPDELYQIEAFWIKHCSSESGGVIKAPFTTNKGWLKYPKQMEKASHHASVEGTLDMAFEELNDVIPYVMMQPCIDVDRKREQKVVFLDGKASHITTGFSLGRGAFPVEDDKVIEFAQKAYDSLRERLGNKHWLDQLARVDIMYNEFEGRMVVNEIESLQASFAMEGVSGVSYDIKVMNFLKGYFVRELQVLVADKLVELLNC